jgi:hypothetical protein
MPLRGWTGAKSGQAARSPWRPSPARPGRCASVSPRAGALPPGRSHPPQPSRPPVSRPRSPASRLQDLGLRPTRNPEEPDFRTWVGTVLVARILAEQGEPAPTRAIRLRRVREAIADVSAQLGNTPTICRKCYVHPAVIETYVEKRPRRRPHRQPLLRRGLRPEEVSVLSMLGERVAA